MNGEVEVAQKRGPGRPKGQKNGQNTGPTQWEAIMGENGKAIGKKNLKDGTVTYYKRRGRVPLSSSGQAPRHISKKKVTTE